MTKAQNEKKKELARSLYLSGMEQQEIADKVEVSRVTISKWCNAEGWKETRAAKSVTRPELVNKLLLTIDTLITQDEAFDNKNIAAFTLAGKISQNKQNDKSHELIDGETNDEVHMNTEAINFTAFLQKHIHGMELTVVPKFAYDKYNNRQNTNESMLTYSGETIAELDDYYILSNNESNDINEYYYIIENENAELSSDKTKVKNPSECGCVISPDNFFKIMIDATNKFTNSNEKLFKCIKYLKKAGE